MSRLVDKAGICAYLGHITASTYDNWFAKGIVCGPIRGTNRYDIRAHDLHLDKIGGLREPSESSAMSPLEAWERSNAA